MSHVSPSGTEYLSCAETAKLVRAALKREFPGIKFSVRSDTYAGGASMRIRWTDGPTGKAVDAVAGVFAGADFDGSIDLKCYSEHWLEPDGTVKIAHAQGTENSMGYLPELIGDPPSPNARLVSLGADYVFTNRDLSDEFVDRILRLFEIQLGEGWTLPRDRNEWWQTQVPLAVGPNGELYHMVKHETEDLSTIVHRFVVFQDAATMLEP